MMKLTRFFAAAVAASLALGPSSAHAAASVAAVRGVQSGLGSSAAAGAGALSLSGAAGLNSLGASSLSVPAAHTLSFSAVPAVIAEQPALSDVSARVQSPAAAQTLSPSAATESRISGRTGASAAAASEGGTSNQFRGVAVAVETRAPKAVSSGRSNSTALTVEVHAASAGRFKSLSGLKAAWTPKVLGDSAATAAASRVAFDNAKNLAAGNEVSAAGQAVQGRLTAAKSGLKHNGSEGPASGPDLSTYAEPLAPAKASGAARSIKLGWLTAIGMLTLYTVTTLVAAVVGYEFHPSYAMPDLGGEGQPSLLAEALTTFMAAVAAPLNEEVYFRAGMMGLLAMGMTSTLGTLLRFGTWATKRWEKLSARIAGLKRFINPAVFVYAGLVTAGFFVVLHETSDPVLLTTRMIQAVLMSWLFAKEGILSAIFHHGFFNLLAGTLFFAMAAMPGGAIVPLLGPSALLFLGYSLVLAASVRWMRGSLKRENAEISAGARTPYRLNAKSSTVLGLVSLFTTAVLLVPGLAWSNGMLLGMAIQMMPAAFAFLLYARTLEDYRVTKSEKEMREKVTEPTAKYAMFNAPGAWTAAKTYLGLLGAILGLGAGLAFLPQMPGALLLALGVFSLASMAGNHFAKSFTGKSIWGTIYTVLMAGALGILVAPYALPVLEVIQEMAAAMQQAMPVK